jgi:hypothetical protein
MEAVTTTITPERHLQVPALASSFKWQQLNFCCVITNTTLIFYLTMTLRVK